MNPFTHFRKRNVLAIAIFAVGVGCATPYPRGTVLIQTEQGSEQGVATQYGIVFLGRTAREGPCEIVTFFGDGVSVEPGRIRSISDQLYKADTDLRTPSSEISFTYPSPEDDLLIGIVNGEDTKFYKTRLAVDGVVNGTAVEVPSGFPTNNTAAGAPLYRREDSRYRLIGLVNGLARFNAGGRNREVLTFLGPMDLIPLATLDHDHGRPKAPPHREDILR